MQRLSGVSACLGLALAVAAGAMATGARAADAPGDAHLIVECKLPGQIRKLGRNVTFLTPERLLRTSQRDCEIRGGTYVLRDPASYAAALDLWLPRAKNGEPRAQLYVGEIHEAGVAGRSDPAEARRWYRKAAAQDYRPALVNLAQLYETGAGGPRDPDQARALYARAARLDEPGYVPASAAPPTAAAAVAASAELTAARAELARERDALARERAAVRRQREALAADRTRAQEAETDTTDLAEQRTELARERDRLARQRAELAARERRLAAQAERGPETLEPPRIALIDPDLAQGTTRSGNGAPVVSTRANIATRTIVGKVVPDDALATLLVNGRREAWRDGGVFTAAVELADTAGTPVDVVAVDEWGRKAALSFRLQPEAVAVNASKGDPSDPEITRALLPLDINFGRYHALVIGNNAYTHLPRLQTAVSDARAVGRVLRERYGFAVTRLEDADRYDILSALNKLRETLTERENLLVYYAGHGELDRANMRGHWLPVDAEPDSTANWISNVAITDILNVMSAKHVMVIADSCYSGTLTRSALSQLKPGLSPEKRRSWLRATARAHTRIALTSGGLQPVLDSVGGAHSVFAAALLQVLRENRGILEGNQLFRELSAAVTWTADQHEVRQVPQYAPLRHAGHEGGDFLFVPGRGS